MTNINQRIQYLIEKLNLKKIQFAETLNITPSYVTRLIDGKGQPSTRLIEDIARKFHINEKWLRNGEGEMFAPQEIEDYLNNPDLDPIDKAILKAYINAPSELRVYIKNKIMEIASLQEQQEPRIVEEPKIDLTRPDGLSDSEWDMIVKKRTAEVGQKKAAS